MAVVKRRGEHGPYVTKLAIALVLSIGLATALNLIVFAVAYDAIASAGPGLSENATQVLTGWGGGIIGILGAVFGYEAGSRSTPDDDRRSVDE